MPNTVANKKYFSFVAGLNTEAGPLTYPPNSWKDGLNVVPKLDGSIRKRRAVDYEDGYTLFDASVPDTTEDTLAFSVGTWAVVAGRGTRNFKVVQRGALLSFFEDTTGALSTGEKTFTVDLTPYKAVGSTATIGQDAITGISTNGKYIIVSGSTEPLLLTYNEDTDTLTVERIAIEIRDLVGLDDGMAVDESLATLSNEHYYNLLNQGWNSNLMVTYFGATDRWPTNAQQWVLGKDASDVFTPSILQAQDFGTSQAPRGRFVVNAFNIDRAAVSGLPIEAEITGARPVTCAFYAGRAWYAGVNDSKISSWVMFSQVAVSSDNYGKCYQDADPTSEIISDLVDTDGGVIPIQDAGEIVKLLPFANSVMVFADNGVWQISGDTSGKFSATSYEVKKVSSVGCANAKSVVEAEQAIFYWAVDGIWIIKQDQVGNFVTENLTNTTIQTFFQAIPITGRSYAVGNYHTPSKTIYWLYNDNPLQDGVEQRFKKNAMLCFDLRLKSFFPLSVEELASATPYIVDFTITKQSSDASVVYGVAAGSDTVVVGSDTVVVSTTSREDVVPNIKFLTVRPSGSTAVSTFAEFRADELYDWLEVDGTGVDYSTYIVTGDDLGAEQGGDKAIQGLYIVSFMNRTETGIDSLGNAIRPSSCLMQARWDWTDSSAANKWSVAQQIYRHKRVWNPPLPSATYADGYPVVTAKSKIRGRGKSVSIKFTGEAGKDMELVGWSVTFLGNSNV